MKTKSKFVIPLVFLLMLSLAGVAQALEESNPPCEGDSVEGTVVAVDEDANEATIDMGDGELCTVDLGGDYSHPIVALFDAYFGTVDADDLNEAVENVAGWAVYDEDTKTWSWASEGDEGAVPVTVTNVVDEGDGTFTFEATTEDGDPIEMSNDDSELAESLDDSVDALSVDWELQTDSDGNVSVVDVGDEVAAYHEEDGLGFGELTKFYAIAEESQEACEAEESSEEPTDDPAEDPPAEEELCGVTVEELVEAYLAGMSMGDIFAEYGKPAMLGVGHIRQALSADGYWSGDGDGDGGNGICNARSKGGNAYATGKNVDC
jgi:hypothetical protein